MRRGFTLIELLIVVAMIAILTAIAVPNFVEAETRQKVSRCSADMRILATAIEAYAVDRGSYPCAYTGYWFSSPLTGPSLIDNTLPGVSWNSYRFRRLTTPVAYITTVYQDPFAAAGYTLNSGLISTNYDTYDYFEGTAAYPGSYLDTFTAQWRGAGVTSGAMWRLVGCGPDEMNTFGGNTVAGTTPALIAAGIHDYDPTNGTVSRGDIVRISALEGPINWAYPSRWPAIDRIRNQYNLPAF